MSLGASIKGWNYCRPVISVDGTFLTSKYRGTLFMACGMDAENHIFPLAVGIGDSENDASWQWFFERLRTTIGVHQDLVIISDRHRSIENGVSKVFPEADHVSCNYHLLCNLKSHLKFCGNDRLFEKCAKAYLKVDFEFYMRQMEAIKPSIRQYLVKAKFERWARSYSIKKRYNIMSSNISESLNSVMKDARDLPGNSFIFLFALF